MTPDEALVLLNQATAHVNATREVHQKIHEAVKVLSDFIVKNTSSS